MVGLQMRNYAKSSTLDLSQGEQLEFWSVQWGVSADEIKEVASRVGDQVDDIAAALGEDIFFPKG
jgi:hypothetical protein